MKITKHVIKWKSKITGAEGQGKPLASKQEAKDWCKFANNEIPELIHWVESVEVEVPNR